MLQAPCPSTARRPGGPRRALLPALLLPLALACNPELTPATTDASAGSETTGGSDTEGEETTTSTGSSGAITQTVTAQPDTTSDATTETGGASDGTETSGATETTSSASTDSASSTSEGGGVCGDGVTEGDEQCDGGGEDTAQCDVDCTLVVCGDGHVNAAAGEQCDPGSGLTDAPGCVGPETALAELELLCLDGQQMFVTASTYQIDAAAPSPDDAFHSRGDQDEGRVSADERCQQEADGAGLEGSYRAWLSVQGPGGAAIDHVGVPMNNSLLLVGYLGYDPQRDVGPDTFVFADSWDVSYGIVPVHPDDAAFIRPVAGVYPAPAEITASWTASTLLGQLDTLMGAASDCGAWKDDNPMESARIGRPGIPYQWSQSDNPPKVLDCGAKARLFCVEAP